MVHPDCWGDLPRCVSHGLSTEVSRHQCVCKETCAGDLVVGWSTCMYDSFFVIHDELFHGRYESLWRGSLNQAGVAWLPGAYRTDIHVYSRVSNPKTFGLLVTRTNFHVCKWSLCTKFRRDPPSSCLGFEGIPQWIGYCSVKSKHHLVSLAPLFGSN
jgi:hypothetical protein